MFKIFNFNPGIVTKGGIKIKIAIIPLKIITLK